MQQDFEEHLEKLKQDWKLTGDDELNPNDEALMSLTDTGLSSLGVDPRS